MLMTMISCCSWSKIWTFINLFILLFGNIDSNATLINLPTNQATIATSFTGLTINSGDILRPSSCSWTYNPSLKAGVQFYSSYFDGCTPFKTANYSISCSESSGVVSSNLTFLTPLTRNVTVMMSCSPSPTYNLQVIVKGNIDSNATLINLPTNQATIPTGVTGLEINSGDISSPSSCSWTYNPGLTSGFQFYSSSFGGCQSSTTANYRISCSESSGVVSSNLTFLTPLTSNVSVMMSCDPTPTYNLQVIVKDPAPTATLTGNNIYYVGDNATFQCNAIGGFPLADRVEVYFNGQIQALNGNTWTSTALTSSNNGDIVECRAISKYTSIAENNHLGRDKKTLNVYYGAESFTVDGVPNNNRCTWYIATPGLRSCIISFSLNPATYTTYLTKNGTSVINDANPIQTSSPTFIFFRNKPTYNDNGVYTLRINNDNFQVDFNFSISVINMTAPSEPPITKSHVFSPPNTLELIIRAMWGGVVLLIFILVVYYFVRKQRNKTKKCTGNTQSESNFYHEPVDSVDHGYVEINHYQHSACQNVGQNITIEPSTLDYWNFNDNVSVVRDNFNYVEMNALDPNVETDLEVDSGCEAVTNKDSKGWKMCQLQRKILKTCHAKRRVALLNQP